ncbi:MAG: hypothetical protein ACE5PV_02985 [Candidatus Poribacteria bacterium]
MFKKTFFGPKYNLIFTSLCFCCALLFLWQVNRAAAEEESRTLTSIIPYDTIVYLSISNLDEVSQTAVSLPEWEELYSMDEIEDGLQQPEQLLTMLLGLTPEEFIKFIGHKLVFSFLGIENNMPIACLAIDAGENREQAQYAIEQLISFTALSGEMTPREDSYREVPYTGINLGELEIDYGFLDNFVLAGINGGFEKIVNLYKDGGKSIEDNPNFQFIGKKIGLASEICLLANVEQAMPILPELQKLMNKDNAPSEKSEADKEFQQFLEETILPSIKAFGLSLSLSGLVHKAYLHIEPIADNPLFNLLLTAHPTMSSIKFLPVDGALAGIQIGDPVALFDSLLNVMEFFGQNREDIEKKISEAEQTVGLNLRDDLLSALTGEIGVMALLPNTDVNLKKNKLDFGKLRPILLLGVNDRNKLEKTASKITQLAQLRTKKLDEEEYRDFKIFTTLLPINMLIPGAALMPAYAYKDDLLIVSNAIEWVKDAIDMLSEFRQRDINAEVEEELKSSWMFVFANVGEISDFVIRQNLIGELKLPENAIDKLQGLGSISVNYSAESDGIGISILSENPWIENILRAVALGVYADQAKKEKSQEQPKE